MSILMAMHVVILLVISVVIICTILVLFWFTFLLLIVSAGSLPGLGNLCTIGRAEVRAASQGVIAFSPAQLAVPELGWNLV